MYVTIMSDLVIACCLLYNFLLDQSLDEVAHLLGMTFRNGAPAEVVNNLEVDLFLVGPPNMDFKRGEEKHAALGRYLLGRQNLP